MVRPILIVDDDDENREVLTLILWADGYSVVAARDGAEALTMAREYSPALILLDVMMPVMDGREFRARQQADPEIAGIPVVLVTALGHGAQVARQLHINHHVTKPIEVDALLALVRDLAPAPPPGDESRAV